MGKMLTDGELFQFNLDFLFFVGLWPKSDWSRRKQQLYQLYGYFIHILSLTFIVITGIGSYRVKDDIPLFMANLDKSCVAYNFVFKVYFFVNTRDGLMRLITEIQKSGDDICEKRKKQMAYHIILITSLASALTSLFSAISLYKREMLVEAWLPFDALKNFMNLLLSLQLLAATFFVPCLYRGLAMQGIVCSIVMYICDQLIEIQNRLKELKYNERTDPIMREELKRILQKHVRIIRYANTLTKLYKEFFLIQNLAVTFELCLNAMMVTLMGSENKTMFASFLAFLSLALINALIFCHMGNELIIQSVGVAKAAYECGWTVWPLDLQKNILIILTVAQKPLVLSAGGMKIMCMQTFGQALYNAYSLFALLNDMID